MLLMINRSKSADLVSNRPRGDKFCRRNANSCESVCLYMNAVIQIVYLKGQNIYESYSMQLYLMKNHPGLRAMTPLNLDKVKVS